MEEKEKKKDGKVVKTEDGKKTKTVKKTVSPADGLDKQNKRINEESSDVKTSKEDKRLFELVKAMAKSISDKKGFNITLIKVDHITTLADYFLIASAKNSTQVRALYDNVDDEMSKLGVECRRREGIQESRWIAMDYGFAIVHIFLDEVREFYQLERLWTDGANIIELENID